MLLLAGSNNCPARSTLNLRVRDHKCYSRCKIHTVAAYNRTVHPSVGLLDAAGSADGRPTASALPICGIRDYIDLPKRGALSAPFNVMILNSV